MVRAAFLEYFTSDSGTLVFLVDDREPSPAAFEAKGPDGAPATRDALQDCVDRMLVDFHGLPPGWDDAGKVERYKRLLAMPPAVRALRRRSEVSEEKLADPNYRYGMDYWQRYSDALLPGPVRERLADRELVCVIPHGPLHALPFAALRWSADAYLGERFGLCHAPSLGVLHHCQNRNRARLGTPSARPLRALVAAVAARDDEGKGQDPRDLESDGESLAALLGGRFELASVVGPGPRGVTREAVKTLVAGRDLVHFSCHGVFGLDRGGGDGALDSGLLVSDGRARPPLPGSGTADDGLLGPFLLSAREIFGLDLSADLVTLRACSSGRSEVHLGDDMVGLSRAFLCAGTPSLLVSLWNVNKRTSRTLIEAFYRHWIGGETAPPAPKWRALQLAQQALRDLPDGSVERHPYHWAPFVLVGDWV